MKLLIISHTPHYLKEGQVVGWGSTVMEIDQLAKLFTEVTHLAPLHDGETPALSEPAGEISIGETGRRQKSGTETILLLAYPSMVYSDEIRDKTG